jgi:hypothetical protein
LQKGGIFVSVSGVVPDELRRNLFPCVDAAASAFSDDHHQQQQQQHNHHTTYWEWLRDGSQDLKAGCFIFRKL